MNRTLAVTFVTGVLIVAAAGRANATPMEPHRAARIRAACDRVRADDFGHYVLGGTLIAVGVGLYIPSIVEDRTIRPLIASWSQGMGLGLFTGGAALLLRPLGGGGIRLIEVCERLTATDPDNPVLLRSAERYLNALAVSERSWDIELSIGAGVVGVAGAGLSWLLASNDYDRSYWAAAFLSVPLAFYLDLLAAAPPVRAALRFHRGGFRASGIVQSISLVPLGNGLGLTGTF